MCLVPARLYLTLDITVPRLALDSDELAQDDGHKHEENCEEDRWEDALDNTDDGSRELADPIQEAV
jgi:hypothetical protein